MEVVALIKQLTSLHSHAIEPLYESAPITAAEADILIPLRYAEEPVIARSLADHIGVSRAGISMGLSRLEKRGFIRREAHPADRRAALISITEDGKRVLDSIFPKQLRVEAELLSALGPDRPEAVRALQRLVAVFSHRDDGR
jgi:DNA-binding MarR family transcriptional regulator